MKRVSLLAKLLPLLFLALLLGAQFASLASAQPSQAPAPPAVVDPAQPILASLPVGPQELPPEDQPVTGGWLSSGTPVDSLAAGPSDDDDPAQTYTGENTTASVGPSTLPSLPRLLPSAQPSDENATSHEYPIALPDNPAAGGGVTLMSSGATIGTQGWASSSAGSNCGSTRAYFDYQESSIKFCFVANGLDNNGVVQCESNDVIARVYRGATSVATYTATWCLFWTHSTTQSVTFNINAFHLSQAKQYPGANWEIDYYIKNSDTGFAEQYIGTRGFTVYPYMNSYGAYTSPQCGTVVVWYANTIARSYMQGCYSNALTSIPHSGEFVWSHCGASYSVCLEVGSYPFTFYGGGSVAAYLPIAGQYEEHRIGYWRLQFYRDGFLDRTVDHRQEDFTPPTNPNLYLSQGNSCSRAQPSWRWASSDPDTGISAYLVQGFDGLAAPPQFYPASTGGFDFSGLPTGTYGLQVTAYNNGNGLSDYPFYPSDPFLTTASSVVSAGIDLTAPTVGAPFANYAADGWDGWYVTAPTVTVTASDPGCAPLSNNCYSISTGGAECRSFSPFAFTYPAQGQTTICTSASDSLGNGANGPCAVVKMDLTNPTTPSTSVAGCVDGQWCDIDPTFTWSATDPLPGSGLYGYEVVLDGVSYLAAPTLTTLTTVWAQQQADGVHTFKVRAIDNAGRVGTFSAIYTIKIDTTAPVVSAVTLAPAAPNGNEGWYTTTVTVTGTGSDGAGSGIDKVCWDVTITATTTQCVVGNPGSITLSQDGANHVDVYTVDKVGRVSNSTPLNIKIDRALPTTPVLSETACSATAAAFCGGVLLPRWTWSGSDQGPSGIDAWLLEGTGFNAGPPLPAGTNTFSPSLSDGVYSLRVRGQDHAGNLGPWSNSRSVSIDRTPPTVTGQVVCPLPGDDGWCRSRSASLVVDATDPTVNAVSSGVKEIRVKVKGAESVIAGSHAVVTFAYEDRHNLEAWAVDRAGNAGPKLFLDANIDATPPVSDDNVETVPPNGENGWYTRTTSLNIQAQDIGAPAASGVRNVAYTLNGATTTVNGTFAGVTMPADGVYQLQYRARDIAGNIEAPHVLPDIRIDSNRPETTMSSSPATPGPSGWHNQQVLLEFDGVDVGPSGVAATFSQNGLSGPVTAGDTRVLAADGTYSVRYWSKDFAGNTEFAKTAATVRIDRTAPTTTVALPSPAGSNGWHTSSTVAAALTGVDPGDFTTSSRLDHTEFKLDTGAVQLGSSVSIAGDGAHTLRFASVDRAGNREEWKTAAVPIDTVPPTVANSVSGTGAAGWYRSNVVVTLTASDVTSGVDRCFMKLDAGAESVRTSLTVSTDGIHTVAYRCLDLAGHQTAGSVEVKRDTVAPSVVRDAPGDLTGQAVTVSAGTTLKVRAHQSDPTPSSGYGAMTATLNGQVGDLSCTRNTGSTFECDINVALKPDAYSLTITGRDLAGNSRTTAALTVIVVPANAPAPPSVPAAALAASAPLSASTFSEPAPAMAEDVDQAFAPLANGPSSPSSEAGAEDGGQGSADPGPPETDAPSPPTDTEEEPKAGGPSEAEPGPPGPEQNETTADGADASST